MEVIQCSVALLVEVHEAGTDTPMAVLAKEEPDLRIAAKRAAV